MKHFVLMADIKDSRLNKSRLLLKNFKELTLRLNQENRKNLLSPLTITLGDEFQGIVNSLYNCIQIMMMSEELILKEKYKFKLRYVINYGNIDTRVNKAIAYGMLGSGLTEAREKLNMVKKSESRFLIEMHNDSQNKLFNDMFFIYQSLVDDWKVKDLEIINAFIEQKDYKKVSEIVNLDPSSAWRRERSLRIKEYFAIKNVILSLSKDI
jgi:hypothetical protein